MDLLCIYYVMLVKIAEIDTLFGNVETFTHIVSKRHMNTVHTERKLSIFFHC